MLYVKLALRNLKRSLRTYGIFFLTMVFSVMIMYAFNTCAFSSDLKRFAAAMENFESVIIATSLFIVVLMGWLVSYISKFIIRKRSREFGMYSLMGMSRRQMTGMFLCEQIAMGILALLFGCLLGQLLAQFLNYILINVFTTYTTIELVFSWDALGITLGYVFLMYIVEIIREWYYLHRICINDLLHADKKNEKQEQSKIKTLIYSILAIVCAAIGTKYLHLFARAPQSNGEFHMLLGILILIASVYFLYLSLSGLLHVFMKRFKTIKYRGNTMFFYGALNSKIRSNRFVLATLTILSIFSLTLITIGLNMKQITDASIKDYMPYDISLASNKAMKYENVERYLNEHDYTFKAHSYVTYFLDTKESIMEALKGTKAYYPEDKSMYLKYSDYKALMNLKGVSDIPVLQPQEYGISIIKRYEKEVQTYAQKNAITYKNNVLKNAFVSTEEIEQSNYNGFYIILPDAYFDEAKQASFNRAYVTDKKTTAEMSDALVDSYYKENDGTFRVKEKWSQENLVSYAMISFILFYTAIIFMCVSATILAIQQLSDLDKQKAHFQILMKMGLTTKEVQRLMAKQIVLYFLLPIIIELIYVLPILSIFNILFDSVYGEVNIYIYFMISFLLFFILYWIYYLMTYYMSKKNLSNKTHI